jgi:hypothetical protein
MAIPYRPIDASRGEIRLLELLHPSESEVRPACRIHHHSLDETKDYCALSYVWGDSSSRKMIVVDGIEVSVTENLHNALLGVQSQRMTHENWITDNPILWIDAICIDQANVSEKSAQIPLMHRIYSSAIVVLSHLRAGSEQLNYTAFVLESLVTHVLDWLEQGRESFAWLAPFPQVWKADGDKTSGSNRFWRGLHEFVLSAYWTRAWIYQELIVASKVIFYGGTTDTWMLSFDTLAVWHLLLYDLSAKPITIQSSDMESLVLHNGSSDYRMVSQTIELIAKLRIIYDNQARRKILHISDFYTIASRSTASDPRDMIYAHLGTINIPVAVDYSQTMSACRLYTRFAEQCVGHGEYTSVISFSGLGWNRRNKYDLPSWVPDWMNLSSPIMENMEVGGVYPPKPHYLMGWRVKYRANQGMPGALVQPCINGTRLKIRGCIVEHVAQPLGLAYDPSPGKKFLAMLDDIRDYCRRLIARPFTKSAPGIPPLQMVFRVLCHEACGRGSDELYDGDPKELLQAVLSFLRCLVVRKELKAENIMSRLEDVGFDPDVETWPNFLRRTLLSTMDASKVSATLDDAFSQARIDASWVRVIKALARQQYTHEDIRQLPLQYKILSYFTTAPQEIVTTMVKHMEECLYSTRLLEMSDGGLALVPPATEDGDLLCIMAHCNYPIILRRSGEHYIHVGPCYAFGYMAGEAAQLVKEGKLAMQDFTLI